MLNAIIVCLYVVAYIAVGVLCASIAYRFDRNARQCDMGLIFTFFWPLIVPMTILIYMFRGIDALIWKLSGRQ